MKHDLEAFTAALLARRPDLGLQENATLHSDISAAFRAYAEEMIAQPQQVHRIELACCCST
jgi:hypothetical protein